MRAAIDVPAVPLPDDKQNRVLSEAKVEAKFKDAIKGMADQLNAGQSVEKAQYQLTFMLDVVALASNPEKMRRLFAQERKYKEAIRRYEEDPGQFNGEYLLINESGGMIGDPERQNAADDP